ncbi:hypothetical protein ABZ454_22440 [Streptomyces sp. NPDC005803]
MTNLTQQPGRTDGPGTVGGPVAVMDLDADPGHAAAWASPWTGA